LYGLTDLGPDKKQWLECRRLAQLRDGRAYHLTFDIYNDLNFKTKNMTLRDLYLKQLMSVPGITPEKAMELVKRLPTLVGLLEALEGKSDAERVQFFEELTRDEVVHTRKVTRAPARKLALVLGAETYPTAWPRA